MDKTKFHFSTYNTNVYDLPFLFTKTLYLKEFCSQNYVFYLFFTYTFYIYSHFSILLYLFLLYSFCSFILFLYYYFTLVFFCCAFDCAFNDIYLLCFMLYLLTFFKSCTLLYSLITLCIICTAAV